MASTSIDLTPRPSLIQSVRQQGLGFATCLCELCDNSFDVGSTVIYLCWDPETNSLTITDNGRGCADLTVLLRLGDREETATTVLGRYGIGAKDAFISLGREVDIVSRHAGVESRLRCDWARLEQQRDWHIPGPSQLRSSKPSGTEIRISRLYKSYTHEWPGMLDKLARTYMPALEDGREIWTRIGTEGNFTRLLPFTIPPLDQVKTSTLSVAGRTATVMMGFLPAGMPAEAKTDYMGMMAIYGYRVLPQKTRLGQGSLPTPGLFGAVTFGPEWQLTKNKLSIADDLTRLRDRIEQEFADLIMQARQQGETLPLQQLRDEINALLRAALVKPEYRKERRKAPTHHDGTHAATGRGPRRRNFRESQPGDEWDQKVPAHAIQISFEALGNTRPLYYVNANIVTLNLDNPQIQQMQHNPLALRMQALNAVATYLIYKDPKQLPLPGIGLDQYETDVEKIAACVTELARAMDAVTIQAA